MVSSLARWLTQRTGWPTYCQRAASERNSSASRADVSPGTEPRSRAVCSTSAFLLGLLLRRFGGGERSPVFSYRPLLWSRTLGHLVGAAVCDACLAGRIRIRINNNILTGSLARSGSPCRDGRTRCTVKTVLIETHIGQFLQTVSDFYKRQIA